jgi:hypothetical protein
MQALPRQRPALQHPEAVLLVDDDQRQRPEADAVLDQRMRADDETDLAGGDLGHQAAPGGVADAAGQQADAEAGAEQPALERAHVLFGEDLGRRHDRHLEPVLHRHHRGDECHHRLARSDVALQQPLHRPRPLHVGDDVAQRRPLPVGELERQHGAGAVAHRVVDGDDVRLTDGGVLPAAQRQAGLIDEEVLEDEPLLGRRAERVQRLDVVVGIGKVRLAQCGTPIRPPLAGDHGGRQQFGQWRRQQAQHVVHQPAMHVRGDDAGAFVDRDDSASVQRLAGAVVTQHLELRRGQLQAAAAPVFGAADQHDALMRFEHVLQERLIWPDHLHLSGGILHERGEQPEPWPARGRQPALQHFAEHRGRRPWLQAGNRLEAAAVLVAAREAEQQVFDGTQSGLGEVGGPSRANPLHELERNLEGILGHGAEPTARPWPGPGGRRCARSPTAVRRAGRGARRLAARAWRCRTRAAPG